MPLINNPIVYSNESLLLISEKKRDPSFNHINWGDNDLQKLRLEIRTHYRNIQRLICVYCQEPIAIRSAAGSPIEHIVPKSQYLEFIFEPKNLCVICPDCNEYKGKNKVMFEPVIKGPRRRRYPTVSTAFQILHPHFDDYSTHILKANRIYVDLTPKGHFTIGICKLNRFFHLFGACDEFVNDAEIAEANDLFFSTGELNRTVIPPRNQ